MYFDLQYDIVDMRKKRRTPSPRVGRIQVRLPLETKALIEQAAEATGSDLTGFVVTAAHERAKKVLEEREVLRVTAENRAQFYSLLLDPPKANAALRAAFEGPSPFKLVE
jgi:uncharacterized protein (DUF1778 family)